MAAGLESEPDADRDARAQTPTAPLSGFVPPEPEELAEYFPQLEIIELLGKGGMGAVYKARQRALDRLVAVKILPPEVSSDAAFKERFTREARALARLGHQNIVALYDFGQARGLYYFIMEYVDGPNLRQLIGSGELQPEEALTIVPQICEALQFAHDEGVVHRDIKPENILLAKRGQVKIADFGLAKLLGPGLLDHQLTSSHQVMGTLHYMAPEQMRRSQDVDHRADIYSLGVVFYEMLTGQLPIGRFALPSQKTHVDTRLDHVVLRSLESEPDQRYQHASQFETDIRSIAESIPPRIPPKPDVPVVETPPRFSRKAILGALWAPLLLVSVLFWFISIPVASTQREPALVIDSAPGRVVHAVNEETPPSADVAGGGAHARTVERHAYKSHYTPWSAWFLAVAVSLLGISAPFGTTILGLVAISNIRHSQGRLTGLPLALADALLYPLLVLDVLIFLFFGALCGVVFHFIGVQAGVSYMALLGFIALVVPICVVVDFLIVYAAWRKASSPPSPKGT
jgi:serine/threonine protein kinase